MEYKKPEMIDIETGSATGAAAPCNQGWTNYSLGCTAGFANSTQCGAGSFYTGSGCQFGGSAQGKCSWGWGVV
jgi:hypothetical protein